MQDFIRFLNSSPTSWHASRHIADRLAEADFIPLSEEEEWVLEKGKAYFVVRDSAALSAFRLPTHAPERAVILASHLDSPSLKLKPICDLSQYRATQFSTEAYGSPLLHTWLDRDLALAGRVMVKGEKGLIESHLVFLDDYPMIIPSLALHLDRSVADKGLILNKQDHLKPIATISADKTPLTLETLLKKHLSFQELLSFDLFLAPLEEASLLGLGGELLASARLDNLTSAFACLFAMTKAKQSHALQMAVFWDHEEIGSNTYLGAESFFVNQVLERICLHEKINREGYFRLKSRSYCISADAAHGYHPNFSDRFDPQNAPYLGDGVVLKTNAMQRYATSASTAAPLIHLSQKKKIKLQKFASRSDISSGSTVGSIMAAVAGIPTVDIGVASWAMHSIRETIALSDELDLCHLLTAALECDL